MESRFQAVIREIVEQLDLNKIRYCLVGGLAATLRGRMRNTEDVDLVIVADVDEAIRFFHALPTDQFGPLFPEAEQVARTACILALEHIESQITLDLAIGMSGFEQQIVSRSESLPIAGITINVATAEDLILMKLLAGRPQDEQDIAGIIATRGDTIDWDYCEAIASQLQEAVAEDFVKRIREIRG